VPAATSNVVQATLLSTVATPTFDPPAGTYTGSQEVEILDTTPDALIFYTRDNTTPTPESTPYTGPIALNRSNGSQSYVLQAIATSVGYLDSPIAIADYLIEP